MRWMGILAAGCATELSGIQVGAEGTPTGPPPNGGVSFLSAGGVTGATPVFAYASSDEDACGWEIAPAHLGDAGSDVVLLCRNDDLPTLRAWSGADAALGLTTPLATWTDPDHRAFGLAGVASVGDVDGDGLDDLSVAPGLADPSGSKELATLIPGALLLGGGDLAAGAWHVLSSSDSFPLLGSGTALGDWNGDGTSDLVVGGMRSSGYGNGFPFDIAVVDGAALGPTTSIAQHALAAWTFTAEIGAPEPREVFALGDVDGDGLADAAVNLSESGVLWILFGGSAGGGLDAAPSLQRSGAYTLVPVPIGDPDGDGRTDLAVLSYGYSGTGQVAIVPGVEVPRAGALDVDPFALSTSAGSMDPRYGVACDVDGDGLLDLLVPRLARWWSGADLTGVGQEVSALTYRYTPRCAGDLDGDGREDLLYGERSLSAP